MFIGDKLGFGAFVLVVVIIVAGVIGYVMNIYKLTQCNFESPYKCEIVHAVGIIPIVGVFSGYMSFEGE